MTVAGQQTCDHLVASGRDIIQAERRISSVQAQVDRLFAAGCDLSTAASVLATLRTMLIQQRLRQQLMLLHVECSGSVLDGSERARLLERRLLESAGFASNAAAAPARAEMASASFEIPSARENEVPSP